MIVVVYVMLTRSSAHNWGPIFGRGLIRNSTPDAKASARRQRFGTIWTGAAWFFRLACRGKFQRDCGTTRHAMDRFDRRRQGLGIRLGPAKIVGELLEKLVDLFALDGLIRRFLWLPIGQLGIVLAQWNLVLVLARAMAIAIAAAIVGEFVR